MALRVGGPLNGRLCALMWAILACRGASAPAPRPELAGCVEVFADGACAVDGASALRVWTPLADAVLSAPGDPVEGPVAVGGGRRWTVHGPAPGTLTLTTADAAVRVALVAAPEPDALDAIAADARSGDLTEAEARLAALAVRPEEAGRAAGLRARLALRAGDEDAAAASWRGAVVHHAAQGRLTSQARDTLALVWLLRTHGLGDPGEPARLLEQLGPVLALDADAAARAAYHRALVARDAGDLRTALRALDEAAARAARLDLTRVALDVLTVRAPLLDDLGRADEAAAQLHAALESLPPDADPCLVADLRVAEGWSSVVAWQLGRGGLAWSALEAAPAAYAGPCRRPDLEALAHTNVAVAAALAGDADRAEASLAAAAALGGRPDLRLWGLEVRARVAGLRGDAAGAAASWRALVARADAAGQRDLAWRGRVGLAETLEAASDPAALEAWQDAEARLDALARAVPLGEGRATFLGDRERSARGLVDALLRAGRTREALDAGRAARRRALAALADLHRHVEASPARLDALRRHREVQATLAAEAVGDWELPLDALEAVRLARMERLREAREDALEAVDGAPPSLSPLPPGLTLAWLPVRDGLALFVVDGERVTAHRVGHPGGTDAATLADQLLGPAREAIAGAARLHLLAWGTARDLDLHMLPLEGHPLVDRAPVAWWLDLGDRAPDPRLPRAAVLADARGDLPHAAEEGAEVARFLGVRPLLGDAVDRRAALDALENATLVHLSGHAAHAGWQSTVPLAGEDALTIPDVLGLRAAPRDVLLSACEGARSGEGAGVEDIGLAHALVIAGAGQVVAATRAVEDRVAARIGVALVREVRGGELGDAAVALQRALVEVRRADPGADVGAWRVLER